MPFFSVIIPTYNRYKALIKAIDSVYSQSYKNYELIVVDDGSTDDTPNIANKYNNSLKYIRQKNSGVSSARNVGILNSDSPFITFLDSDDQWLPKKLEKQHYYIKDNPLILINQTDEIWIRNGKKVNAMKKHRKKGGDIFTNSLELCLVSPSCVAIRRDIFNSYGLFDEDLPACEDYDLWLRITLKEKVGLIKNKLVMKYGGHSDQLSRRYWGMDRFRVYSILKLINNNREGMSPKYLESAINVARKKCEILRVGSLKRGNNEFADNIQKIIECFDDNSYSNIDIERILKKLLNPR